MDTRPAPDNVGNRRAPLAAGEELTLQVHGSNGNCSIPATATAIAYNLTVPTSIDGYLTLYPAGAVRPTSSSINPVAGEQVKANSGIVGLSASGAITLFTLTGPVDAIVDITGYYTKLVTPTPNDVIPSGTTVRGEIHHDLHQPPNAVGDMLVVSLPGVAPVALTSATVNFGTPGTMDRDPSCTGTVQVPTAPPGKVCLYLAFTEGVFVDTVNGFEGLLPKQSFKVQLRPEGTDNADFSLAATWAYTAP